jgi:hypothetical protein
MSGESEPVKRVAPEPAPLWQAPIKRTLKILQPGDPLTDSAAETRPVPR